jgi:hypothetical protein
MVAHFTFFGILAILLKLSLSTTYYLWSTTLPITHLHLLNEFRQLFVIGRSADQWTGLLIPRHVTFIFAPKSYNQNYDTITGGAGYIGSITAEAIKAKHDVVVLVFISHAPAKLGDIRLSIYPDGESRQDPGNINNFHGSRNLIE